MSTTKPVCVRLDVETLEVLELIADDLVVSVPWVMRRAALQLVDNVRHGGDLAEALTIETRRKLEGRNVGRHA